ncbi:MAG TPA: ABC transporter ATP-binding protein [Acidobacteriota bacterium]|nr:ABC transporter ATP-binding protein [Acidobacteriota bacterium]
MIETKNLKKVYTTGEVETTALDNVNLRVKQGEFTAIMGPSGCGKSTLLNILGLIDNPTAGQYFFAGEDVSGYSERQRADLRKRNIGYVFQSFNLIDELTVFENIELPLLYMKARPDERRERILEVMEQLKLAHRQGHFPKQLSGGQQQRVAVARAIVGNPKLILADEPTGNLDSTNGEEIMSLLTGLNEKGSTIVIVTHSEAYAECSQRIVHLFDGHIVAENMAA